MAEAVSIPAADMRRQIRAWVLYDVASSTYAAAVPSVLFALHFTADIAAGHPNPSALWGVLSAAALVVAGIVAPIAGAWADGRRARARLLALFTLTAVVGTALLALPARGQIALAAAAFLVAQVGYIVATALYDAYLERLAPHGGGAERLSTRGWALGFLGGIVVLAILLMLPRDPRGAPDPSLSFPTVALLFAAIAVPAILGLRRVPEPRSHGPAAVAHPWRRVAATLRGWREYRPILRFLLATYLINDAMVTVGVFVAIHFRDQFGMGIADVLRLTLLYHLIALPATWLFGVFAHRATARAALSVSLAIWVATIALLAFGQGHATAVVIVVLLASVLGATQALLRGMYTHIVPPARAAEFFGFNALAGRLSAAVGPLLFAAVTAATGSSRLAILSLLLFLGAGGALLWRSAGPGERAA